MTGKNLVEPMLADGDKEGSYIKPLNESLRVFFKDALRITVKNPRQALFFMRTIRWQTQAARVRSGWKRQDIHVPPIMIFSITNRCNLHCKGCYAQALRPSSDAEMSEDKLRSIFAEAKELGISFAVLAGGEPLVRPEILNITREFPEIICLLFTNGLLIDEELLVKFKKQRHVVPVISMEGYEEDTDGRRGRGVYERLKEKVAKLDSNGIFFGVSLTVTRTNLATVTSERFIEHLIGLGCKLFFFPEYTPIKEGTEDWVIADEQRAAISRLMQTFRSKYPALFVSVPGDEEEFGGCLAAGRGFVHISAEGDLEACPFAPISDTNLRDLSFKEALQSELLRTIRQNSEQLGEGQGGCALWEKRDWIRSLLPAHDVAA